MKTDNSSKTTSIPAIVDYKVRFTTMKFGSWRKYYASLAVNYFSKVFLLLFMDFYPSLKH